MKSKPSLILIFSLLVILLLAGIGLAVYVKNQKDQIAKMLQEQKQLEAQKNIETQNQLEVQKGQAEAKKKQTINEDLDKILTRLNRVFDEPTHYAFHSNEQRDNDETRLRQIASAAKAEISDIIIELENTGFTNGPTLEASVQEFFKVYDGKIHFERLGYDGIERGEQLNDSNQKELRSDSIEAASDAQKDISTISNLKIAQ